MRRHRRRRRVRRARWDDAWKWAALSAVVHVPYTILLARAYDTGGFSQVYPLARGLGALLAAVGGVALLGDQLGGWAAVAISVVVAGLFLLVGRAPGPAALAAVGASIGGGNGLTGGRGSDRFW